MRAGQQIATVAGLASLASGHALNKRAPAADGTVYTACVTPGQVALTFDDGPFSYTQKIVDLLTASGHKATFFQNGQNYDSIFNYGGVLNSMIAGGHQVASHTWSHKDLALLSAAEVEAEMTQLEAAHQSLIGKVPTYMRPPYLSLDAEATDVLTRLGYKIISISIDTLDYVYGPLGQIDESIKFFEGNYTEGGSIVLNHDPFSTTADTFVPAAIEFLNSKGLKSVTIGECLGDAPENWYRQGSTTNPIPSGSALPSASSLPSGSPRPSASSAPGNGTAPHPSSAPYPSSKPDGPTKPGKPGSPGEPGKGYPNGKPGCGDTEPGHGPNAGRGALPGHAGQGNYGHSGLKASNGSDTGSTGSYGGSSPYSNTSAPHAKPTYAQSNTASTITASAIVMLGAAIAMFL